MTAKFAMLPTDTIQRNEAHALLETATIGAYTIELRRDPTRKRNSYYAAFRASDDSEDWRAFEAMPKNVAAIRFKKLCGQAYTIKAHNA